MLEINGFSMVVRVFLVCIGRWQVAKAVVGTAGCPDCLNHWADRVSPSALLLVEIKVYTAVVCLGRRQVAKAVVGMAGCSDCLNRGAGRVSPLSIALCWK